MNTDNDPRSAARKRFEKMTPDRQDAALDSFWVALICLLKRKSGAVQPPEPPADVAPAAFDAGDGAALADAVDAWLQSEVKP